MNDPRAQHSYDKLYTVEYLGNMTAGKPVLYINKPIEFLKEITNKVLTESKEVSMEKGGLIQKHAHLIIYKDFFWL